MGLRDEISAYREPKTRGVSNHVNPGDHSVDNSLLFSAEYIVLLLRGNGSTDEIASERAWFNSFVESCAVSPGLLCRYPGDTGYEEQDDYIGVLVASTLLALPIPGEIYGYGSKNCFCFNNVRPGNFILQQWFGRFPDFVPFVKCCAGNKLNLFDAISASIAYLWSIYRADATDTDDKILLWLKSLVFQGKHGVLDSVLRSWREHWIEKIPGGMRQVFSEYFGPDHPIARYSRTDFG